MVDLGRMAQKGTPYLEEEIPDIIRLTAIELGVHDPVKHQPYKMHSNVTRLVEGFLRRCPRPAQPRTPRAQVVPGRPPTHPARPRPAQPRTPRAQVVPGRHRPEGQVFEKMQTQK